MDVQVFENNHLNEKYYYKKHDFGLNIYVYPKKNYNTSYAILGTRYGSVNRKFKIDSEIVETPSGVAHFLEHKLFECKGGDAFELFSKTGASANAYTSFDKTAYLFSCSKNFYESLSILLDFVQEPYFTDEGVEKEKGIIGQEIKMYSDSPGWKVTFNLLNSMYKNHPVKDDIAGSIESISLINSNLLNKCYDSFYDLSNMTLCLVGDLSLDETVKFVNEKIKTPKNSSKIEKIFPEEPKEVSSNFISEKMEVINPIFSLGFKHKVSGQHMSLKEMITSEMILDLITLKSGNLYDDLLKRKLITTDGLDTELFCGPYYKASIFSGESENPEEVAKTIRGEISKVCESGASVDDFERVKKCYYSRIISNFDRVSSIANTLLDFDFAGYNLFEFINMIENITLEDLNVQVRGDFDQNWSLSIIKK